MLLIAKFIIGAAIGIGVGKLCGPEGLLGLSALAIISAVTNSNGSVYLALMNSYGDTVDQAAMPLLAINDGPMLTMIAMGAGGLADIPFMALVAAIGPILVGMILGNIDKDLSDFLAPAGSILLCPCARLLCRLCPPLHCTGSLPDHHRTAFPPRTGSAETAHRIRSMA